MGAPGTGRDWQGGQGEADWAWPAAWGGGGFGCGGDEVHGDGRSRRGGDGRAGEGRRQGWGGSSVIIRVIITMPRFINLNTLYLDYINVVLQIMSHWIVIPMSPM